MVVDDFDIGGPFLSPGETDAPLIIDPDGVLTTTVASQRFKPVCRWYAQVIEITRSVQHVKFSQRLLFYSAEALHKLAHNDSGPRRSYPLNRLSFYDAKRKGSRSLRSMPWIAANHENQATVCVLAARQDRVILQNDCRSRLDELDEMGSYSELSIVEKNWVVSVEAARVRGITDFLPCFW